MEQRNLVLLRAIRALLAKSEPKKAVHLLDRIPPQDSADIVERLEEDQRKIIFENWDASRSAETLSEMETEEQMGVAATLSTDLLTEIFDEMSIDDAVDILSDLPKPTIEKIVSGFDLEYQNEIRKLLIYDEDTAGGLMTTEIVKFEKTMTVEEALQKFKDFAPHEETSHYLFVVNEENELSGVISLRDLVISSNDAKIMDAMRPDPMFVNVHDDKEVVAKTVAKYNLLEIPVVDDYKKLLGVVTVDDALDVIEEEATEDMYKFAGTLEAEEQDVTGASIGRALKARLPWLFIALLGESVLVGYIVSSFDVLISQVVALTIFWPAITAMGGNAAVQSATIIIRSLATSDFEIRNLSTRIYREARLGLVLGLISGILLFLLAYLWKGMFVLGIIVSSSAMLVLLTALLLGAATPIIFRRFGIDPAVSSGPFLTLMMDATSLLIYLSIAYAVINSVGI